MGGLVPAAAPARYKLDAPGGPAGTNGERKVTDGGPAVTSGERRFRPTAWLVVAGLGFAIATVNATSEILEAQRDGDRQNPAEPFIWELSSLVVILALAPLIGQALRRWPPELGAPALLVHAALTIPFSLVHVFAMWALRLMAYAAAGWRYDFFDGGMGMRLLYEWRKDVLVYALAALTYWLFRERPAPAAPAADARIEIREGATAVFLPPADILYLEAAGNYVEVHTSGRTHLVRGTLAAFEQKLAPHRFVRAHRSRLVNRARVRALKPTPSGDVEISFDDGRTIMASRRFRAGLES